jgi:hypothetical protein
VSRWVFRVSNFAALKILFVTFVLAFTASESLAKRRLASDEIASSPQKAILLIDFNNKANIRAGAKQAAQIRGEQLFIFPDPTSQNYAFSISDIDDYMANLVTQNIQLSSLVLAGHDGSEDFWGDDNKQVAFSHLELVELLRKYAAPENNDLTTHIKSLYLWGCYAAARGALRGILLPVLQPQEFASHVTSKPTYSFNQFVPLSGENNFLQDLGNFPALVDSWVRSFEKEQVQSVPSDEEFKLVALNLRKASKNSVSRGVAQATGDLEIEVIAGNYGQALDNNRPLAKLLLVRAMSSEAEFLDYVSRARAVENPQSPQAEAARIAILDQLDDKIESQLQGLYPYFSFLIGPYYFAHHDYDRISDPPSFDRCVDEMKSQEIWLYRKRVFPAYIDNVNGKSWANPGANTLTSDERKCYNYLQANSECAMYNSRFPKNLGQFPDPRQAMFLVFYNNIRRSLYRMHAQEWNEMNCRMLNYGVSADQEVSLLDLHSPRRLTRRDLLKNLKSLLATLDKWPEQNPAAAEDVSYQRTLFLLKSFRKILLIEDNDILHSEALKNGYLPVKWIDNSGPRSTLFDEFGQDVPSCN